MKAGTIIADPPWKYRNWSDKAHGSPKPHYGVQEDSAITSIPVAKWAGDDCVLACWVTWPKLKEGMDTIEAWGFEYITLIPWIKTVESSKEIYRGIGFWAMQASEGLAIAKRGDPKRLEINGGRDKPIGLLVGDKDEQIVFYAPRRKHSAKPLEIHKWLERTLHGPYLELFGRRSVPNWTVWGRDMGVELTSKGKEPYKPPKTEPEGLWRT